MIFAQFLFDLFILVIIFLKRENILIPSYESVRIMNNMQFIGLEIFFFVLFQRDVSADPSWAFRIVGTE